MWLTIVVGLQVFVAPILAFTATYILDVDWDTYTFSLQINLLPWIISAAMMYGVISLILGLAVGGYMPTRVADAGGWRPVLGLTRRLRDADLVDRARLNLIQSPYGKVTRIVHQEVRVNGRPLLEVHGGLQLLAAPLQIVLIMLPLLVLRFVPGEWLQDRRLLELALLVYLSGLVIGLRLYPKSLQRWLGWPQWPDEFWSIGPNWGGFFLFSYCGLLNEPLFLWPSKDWDSIMDAGKIWNLNEDF